jgi:competence protein ComEA
MQYLPQSRNVDVSFDSPQNNSITPLVEQKFMVDISGAVINPGVYAFGSEERIVDAIKKAGGLATNADTNYIAKSVNEAMKLTDGMKIYIPKVGETIKAVQVADGTGETNGTNTGAVLGTQTGMISINSASVSQLDSLPGVGAVTAGKIISGRPYGSVEELLSKKVVSSSVYGKIKNKISL